MQKRNYDQYELMEFGQQENSQPDFKEESK